MSLESDIAFLRNVPIFKGIPDEPLKLLAFSAAKREIAAGGRLFRIGEAAEAGYLVTSGAIELSTGTGPKRVVAETCGEGDFIGELALFVAIKRRHEASARDVSSVMEISRQSVQRMLQEYPAVATHLQRGLARQVSGTLSELEAVRQRLDNLRIG